jgi:hypothetical protein
LASGLNVTLPLRCTSTVSSTARASSVAGPTSMVTVAVSTRVGAEPSAPTVLRPYRKRVAAGEAFGRRVPDVAERAEDLATDRRHRSGCAVAGLGGHGQRKARADVVVEDRDGDRDVDGGHRPVVDG